jgi:hypothetical protein
MKMPATFSEAFLQAELDYRRQRLNGAAARQPRVRKHPDRRRWWRVGASAPVRIQPTQPEPVRTQPSEAAPVCRPIHAGSLH